MGYALAFVMLGIKVLYPGISDRWLITVTVCLVMGTGIIVGALLYLFIMALSGAYGFGT